MQSIDLSAVRAELAPRGTLHVALNLANFLLVSSAPAGAEPQGIAPDLGREAARQLGVPVAFVGYETPGKIADAAASGAWDVAFLGIEAARANVVDFTPAYLEIEATYLVPAGSAIRSIDEVDRPGVRISVSGRSAYDLYLQRTIRQATLVSIDGVEASWQQFVAQGLEALAGLRPRLVKDVQKLPGARVLDGRFTAIQQAMATPRGRTAGATWLRGFVEDSRAGGRVAGAIARHGVEGVTVAQA